MLTSESAGQPWRTSVCITAWGVMLSAPATWELGLVFESRPAGAFLPSLFYPDVLPPIKFINWFYRWVEVGQASVVMAISSPHRHDSQQAIQHCINQLKAKIPIWKKVRTLKFDEEEASLCHRPQSITISLSTGSL